ncbi:sugar phosphate isomerase/epimerase family protein [Murdochiella vaginalis]|uniref:sugar phosphate isomerase/epimerase family protein n=1 Tax=Murdochiella vaginalis TaxID=1852373 RepID=UPI0008FE06EE|nr:sugar phosphate isomerase/epimerase [Murdochiella vaginalis]
MKIGFNQATSLKCSTLEKDLKLCDKMGFDFIEIRFDQLKAYMETNSLETLSKSFSCMHIKPHAMNAVYLKPFIYSNQCDPVLQEAFDMEFLNACDLARQVGSKCIVIVPPFVEPAYEGTRDEATETCVRALKKMSDVAGSFKINLAFELVGLRKSMVRTIKHAVEIVEKVDRPNVGYTFDAFNIYCANKSNDFSDLQLAQKDKIFVVHVNNADGYGLDYKDQSHRRLCDKGVVDLTGFLYQLNRLGYQGMISIETFRDEYGQWKPDLLVQKAYNTTKDLIKDQ